VASNRINPIELMPVSKHARATRNLLMVLAFVLLVFLYVPIAFMILFSFEDSRTPGLPITGLTLDWYGVMLGDDQIKDAVVNSVLVAAVVATLATVIGTMAAFPLVRGRLRFADGVRLLATMPMMIPGFLLGIGLLLLFRRVVSVELSLVTVTAGHLVFTTPFVILLVASRLQGFDRRLEWAAADLGAGPVRTLRHIVLPLLFPAIAAGFLLSVTLSIDEFVVTYFTIGSERTLPLFIYTQVKFGVTPEVNAVATSILVVSLLLFGLGGLVLSRGRQLFRRRR
jgi:ABC-type spermidine/putrescine transport system permease subunit II